MQLSQISFLSFAISLLGMVGCGSGESDAAGRASGTAGASGRAASIGETRPSTAGASDTVSITSAGASAEAPAAGGIGGASAVGGVSGATGNTVANAPATQAGPSLATFCSETGPVVDVEAAAGGSYQSCTGRIAETRFLNALCTCNDATVAGYLKTRSFDSSAAGSTETGGSVGINDTYSITAGYTDIGGTLSIAGSDSLTFAGYLRLGSDLHINGSATVAGYTNVGRDAWLRDGLTDLGPVTVHGNLHTAATMIALPLRVDGQKFSESVAVVPPCPCEPSQLLDVAKLVDDARRSNDNAHYGIDQKVLNLVVGNVEVTLPCGRFYLEQIAGAGNIIVNVTGRVALFIEDDVAAAGNLEFRLAAGAEMDLFIKDNLVLAGRAVFGSAERPAASRIYVGGQGDVVLVGADRFVGNLYAPRSLVTAVGYADVAGSIFARDFVVPGYADFAYDRAIQHAGDSCDVPPPPVGTCERCGTCTSGTACVNGSCSACHTDADCCSPLACLNGVCAEPLVWL
ncbi:MAG TPA: hypothetical protein VKP30_05115 [Polyangiaceae bacterium]|nr:hypothetical protein [Polyangiaceae bacterium]